MTFTPSPRRQKMRTAVPSLPLHRPTGSSQAVPSTRTGSFARRRVLVSPGYNALEGANLQGRMKSRRTTSIISELITRRTGMFRNGLFGLAAFVGAYA